MTTGEYFLLVYSTTSWASFEEIFEPQEQIDRVKNAERWPRVLVASHCDHEKEQVLQADGQALVYQLGCPFIGLSPSNYDRAVEEAFVALVKDLQYCDERARASQPIPALIHEKKESDFVVETIQETESPKRVTMAFSKAAGL
jgi:hypothetical protein